MAKDVITRFKLETTGFDSKIKEAAKNLSAYSKTATQAKEGFDKFTRSNVAAAKALGTMATSTTTAKDRVKELVAAYNDVAKAYEALSEEQKKSDFAKALAGSLTQLQQRIRETKAEMQGLGDNMKGVSGGGFLSGLGSKMEGALAVFGGNLMTKAAGAVAQLGSEMADMVKQGVELAKQGEGIRNAFERLGRGDILDGLRQATHGTVTDIELMKAAVKFNDFKLPLEELGTMLAFAQQKAKDTGQSVDYMVDSIVTGLGRKSLMILDNLGLSAAEIKDKMAETGDMTKAVGAIIREQMAKAGDYVETAADRAAQANVSLQNKMEELGRKFAPVEEASNQLWTSMKIGILDVVGGPLATLLNSFTESGRRMNALSKFNGGENGEPTRVDRQIKRLEGSNFKDIEYAQTVSGYEQEIAWRKQYAEDIRSLASGRDTGPEIQDRIREGQRKSGTNRLDTVEDEIAALETLLSQYQERAKKILEPVKAEIDTTGAGQNVESLKVRLIELEAQRKKAIEAGDNDLSKNLGKQINQVKADIKALSGTITTENKRIRTEEEKNTESIRKLSEEYLKATNERKASIREEIGELQARNKEIKRLKDEAQGITFSEGSLPALNQQLKELQKQQSAAANPQEWQQYQRQIDAVTNSINILKGVLPKDSKAQFTVDVNADQLAQLQSILSQNSQTVRVNVEAGTVNLPEVPTDDETVRVNVEAGTVNLPEVPKDDETIRVNVEATTEESMRQIMALIGSNPTMEVNVVPVGDLAPIDEMKQRIQDSLLQTDFTALSSLLTVSIQNGLDQFEGDFTSIQEAIAAGIDVPDEVWENLQDRINSALEEMKLDPIQLDVNTGKVKNAVADAVKMSQAWNAAGSAIQAVGNAMSLIEDPMAKVMGTIAQAIAAVALGAANALASSKDHPETQGWAWIAFAASVAATMVGTIAAIHSATGYANGGVVDGRGGGFVGGTAYSGDNIGNVRLDAGELVLNRAQQSALADELKSENWMQNMRLETRVGAEELIFILNNNASRRGFGQFIND